MGWLPTPLVQQVRVQGRRAGEVMGREPRRGWGLAAGSLEPLPRQALPQPRLLPLALGLSPSSYSQVADLGSACSAGTRLLSQLAFCPVSRWPGSQGFCRNDQFC